MLFKMFGICSFYICIRVPILPFCKFYFSMLKLSFSSISRNTLFLKSYILKALITSHQVLWKDVSIGIRKVSKKPLYADSHIQIKDIPMCSNTIKLS